IEDAYINQHLILLKPYLTEAGLKEYEQLKKR
ncbi:TetR/AcrR family transcriptional regulator, partial [Turicibacter sanguinis]|nr:TetR/AcrR family transcriptional regulator [Turicibacter sanguinis]